MSGKIKGLVERLNNGENVLVAEGYLFNFERRGYLKAGTFVPEVVLEHPGLVKDLYREFVHAGSDVVLAFTYYAHRDKMRIAGREDEVEKLNRLALRMAREVADETNTLMAGNICNSLIYVPGNKKILEMIRAMFKEQIEWAVDSKADYMVCETFQSMEEAMLALECVKEYGNGMPAVVCLDIHRHVIDNKPATFDKILVPEALKMLEDAGAAAVGLNCCRGPDTMLPILEEARKLCKGPLAALPVTYRTDEENPTMQSLHDPLTGEYLFPDGLDCRLCSRHDIAKFGKRCQQIGIQYVGLCCGNAGHYTRTLAETYGRKPPASRYSPNMSEHITRGAHQALPEVKQYYGQFVKDPVVELK